MELHRLVFSLTAEEYASLPAGATVIVQYGTRPVGDIWSCGKPELVDGRGRPEPSTQLGLGTSEALGFRASIIKGYSGPLHISWQWLRRCGRFRPSLYFPMQKELKIKFRISSAVVAPVMSSSGRKAA